MAYTLSQGVEDLTPSIVLVGVDSKKALEKVIQKLQLNNIEFSAFYETDGDVGLSAVTTVPLTDEQRCVLRNYKLWNEKEFYACSSSVRAPSSKEDGGRLFDSAQAYQGADSLTMQEV
jgi:hypothetical protein